MRKSWIAGLLVALVPVLVLVVFGSRVTTKRPKAVLLIRGDPIATDAETNSPPTAAQRKRPKPASFPHRLVEFQVAQPTNEAFSGKQGFGTTMGRLVFSDSKLKSLPDPKLPPNCEKLDFYTLSDFQFDLTAEMADGSNNLAAASTATRAGIPSSIQALDGRFVAIRGFLVPLKMKNDLASEILLMRNQNMCCFGKVPKINEWIIVSVPGEGVKPVMDEPITIAGRLHVGDLRENGYLVGIYRMDGTKIYWPEDLK